MIWIVIIHALLQTPAIHASIQESLTLFNNNVRVLNDKIIIKEDVIVIGAGIAGLAAAKKLKEGGYSVLVLEGSDRIGGRIFTNRSLGVPVDLGAAWIHDPIGNPIAELAEKVGLAERLTAIYSKLSLFDTSGLRLDKKDQEYFYMLGDELTTYASQLPDKNHNVQTIVDQFIAERERKGLCDKKDAIFLNNWISLNVESDFAATASKLSLADVLLDLVDDDSSEGDDVLLTEYDRIIKYLANGLAIRYNEKVTRIAYTSDGVTITSNSGKIFNAKYVVCTVPLGVLKHGDITFIPDLPLAKKQAINGLQMGILDKVILEFPHKFWPNSLYYISESKKTIADFSDYSRYVDKPILIGFITGDAAQDLENKTDEEIISGVMNTLRLTKDWKTIPLPIKHIITRWGQNPFSYGSYSFVPAGVSRGDRNVLADPIEARVFFAGEATSYENSATVHGAYLSGIREADRIMSLKASL